MKYLDHFYIDGRFVPAGDRPQRVVVNPATEEPAGTIAMGTAEDVDLAVRAARQAFGTYAFSSREERLAMLRRVLTLFDERAEEFARLTTLEMGAPITFARDAQIAGSRAHIADTIRILETYEFERLAGQTLLSFEPVGVCALITPWNFPVLQIITKVMPALATGCTIVLKPSEYAPISPMLFAEVLHDAGVPAGVFNLINGDGPTVGEAMSRHPDIDMVSFTGSTRAGVQVAKNAADTVKRVHQELGGNSANIVMPDVDLEASVTKGVLGAYRNAGQSCTAPTRMLVPRHLHDKAVEIARRAAESVVIGDVNDDATTLGPVVNQRQFERVKSLIDAGIAEGATLVTGGSDMPANMNRGFFVKPTVFADVTPEMSVAREEMFGPVVSLIPYDGTEQAIAITNDTPYGLAAYLQSKDLVAAKRVASRLRAGQVMINHPSWDASAPFGGFKQSGNGRECGEFGFEAFVEVKAVGGLHED
ncbi:aldehyde dehydrogenase family protein [Rhizobium sp. NZLR1]|uniref:aldehyde dehydrogenase family protein n=1 Tax=Rhizobium sp. NZLR1 TaxID=2731096 RepID=UPI001A9A1366|nr:aldehyde dehydrogenase family protein [Rhizobium sp. NZLR1]MBX5204133.1 aldehyde dehydrogenase family protein [Rhizobium sp. NZLR1]QSZ25077.1 aldehyde dehydrogenase family protein [Rhizobium sp. NZLR1]